MGRNGLSYRQYILFAALLALSIYLKSVYIDYESRDLRGSYTHWYSFLRTHSLGTAYGTTFADYTPLYTYFLGIFGYLFPSIPLLYAIKSVTFIGEILASIWAYRIVALYYQNTPTSPVPLLSFALVLLSPSVIVNGSITGQCDIWLTFFVLAALHSILIKKPRATLVYAGLAFAFKPQAIFLSPLLLILVLRKDIPWKQVWIVPAMYILTCVPAWLEGRPMFDMLMIYPNHTNPNTLFFGAPNPYVFVHSDLLFFKRLGMIITTEAAALLVYLSYKRWHSEITPLNCLLMATFFAGLIPFLLPKMHDRYFFLADILSLLLACMQPRWFMITVLFQWASFRAQWFGQVPEYTGLPALVHSISLEWAIGMNVLAIAITGWLCVRYVWKKPPELLTTNPVPS